MLTRPYPFNVTSNAAEKTDHARGAFGGAGPDVRPFAGVPIAELRLEIELERQGTLTSTENPTVGTCAALGFESPALGNCDRIAVGVGRATSAGRPVVWTHVPKTGTSFKVALTEAVLGAGLIRLTEPRLGLRGHNPVTDRDWESSAVVMLVREPIDRVASAFLHNQHACDEQRQAVRILAGVDTVFDQRSHPMIRCDQGTTRERTAQQQPDISTSGARGGSQPQGSGLYVIRHDGTHAGIPRHLVLEYARCVEGCMANMLTGRQCNDASGSPGGLGRIPDKSPQRRKVPQPTSAERRSALRNASVVAARRMKNDVDFVGFTSRWNESMCRWRRHVAAAHACLNDPPSANRSSPAAPQITFELSEAAFKNSRPGKSPGCEVEVKAILERAQWRDDADEAVYAAAVARVESSVNPRSAPRRSAIKWADPDLPRSER